MIRVVHVSLAFLFVTGLTLAQAPPVPNRPFGASGRGPGFPAVVTGPAAPVPPEVAIARPTPEELARVNDAVAKWVASDKSPDKPLLQKV